jgi:hypothetical protein
MIEAEIFELIRSNKEVEISEGLYLLANASDEANLKARRYVQFCRSLCQRLSGRCFSGNEESELQMITFINNCEEIELE